MAKPLNLGETFMRRLLAIALALGVFATSSLARAEDTIVFAAASTKDVIGDIIALYGKSHPGHIVASFGSSGDLAKQIENGAPASIFNSADTRWMDYVGKATLIDADSRRDLLGNELVLIAPVNSTRPTSLASFPEATHPPIVCPVARIAGHDSAIARDFFAFLEGPEAREVFLSAGFSLIGSGAATN
jgi:ABC-type molybdate transport system substrate-binding protein